MVFFQYFYIQFVQVCIGDYVVVVGFGDNFCCVVGLFQIVGNDMGDFQCFGVFVYLSGLVFIMGGQWVVGLILNMLFGVLLCFIVVNKVYL